DHRLALYSRGDDGWPSGYKGVAGRSFRGSRSTQPMGLESWLQRLGARGKCARACGVDLQAATPAQDDKIASQALGKDCLWCWPSIATHGYRRRRCSTVRHFHSGRYSHVDPWQAPCCRALKTFLTPALPLCTRGASRSAGLTDVCGKSAAPEGIWSEWQ